MELFRPTFSWKDWANHKTSAVYVPCRDSNLRLLNTFRIVTAWPPSSVHGPGTIFMLRLWPSRSRHRVVWQGYPSASMFNVAKDGGSMLLRNVYTQWLPPWEWTHIPLKRWYISTTMYGAKTQKTYWLSSPRWKQICYATILLLPDVGAYILIAHTSHMARSSLSLRFHSPDTRQLAYTTRLPNMRPAGRKRSSRKVFAALGHLKSFSNTV
jgi:hypothetical protein